MKIEFADLLINRPEYILRTVCGWLRQLADRTRMADLDETSARAAANVIRSCPGGDPRLLITRITLPPTINMAAPPGTSYDEYISHHVIPYIAAQRRLRSYQQTVCNMSAARCNVIIELADQLSLMLDEHPTARTAFQYVILHLIMCDVIPPDVIDTELWPFLSLYHRLGNAAAHSPIDVTNGLVSILEAWLLVHRPT